MKRMYAVILVEYRRDPNSRNVYIVHEERILEICHGLRQASRRAKELEAIYDGTKSIDVVYVPIEPTRSLQ